MPHVTGITGIEKWRAEKLVEMFRRECWYVSAGRTQLPRRVYDLFSFEERVLPELVPRMWRVVPPDVRDQLISALREAASPQFRLPLWVRGAAKGMDELEADADLRTGRLRAWAVEFCRFLSASESMDHD